MGCLRVFLALSVVVFHVRERWCLVNGGVAVISFFIISGFYMAMIVNTSYARMGPGWQGKFYQMRALRLFPVYFAALAASAAVNHASGRGSVLAGDFLDQVDPLWWLSMLVANLAIVGLDALTFLLQSEVVTLPDLRELGVSWTLGIELQYYLAAPFIVTRSLKVQVLILAVAVLGRLVLLGLAGPDWRYYFAPADWCFFLLGAVAFRLSQRIDPQRLRRLGWGAAGAAATVAAWADLTALTDFDRPGLWLYYLTFAAAVPAIFALSAKVRWDTALGNLSYAIYIIQFPAINATLLLLGRQHRELRGDPWLAALVIAAVIAAAIALFVLVERPVERLRAGRKRRQLAGPPCGLAPEAAG